MNSYAGVNVLFKEDRPCRSVYRILQLEHLAKWFETDTYPLLSPSKWEDPFEAVIEDAIFPRNQPLPYEKGEIFGLCLTRCGRSDALWRIYSKSKCGICVKISLDNFCKELSFSNELLLGRTFIGDVNYENINSLRKKMMNIFPELSEEKKIDFAVNSMLLKRKVFSYENEVRILHFTKKSPSDGLLYFTCDPRKIIKSIIIDPRASKDCYENLKNYFSNILDFHGTVFQSNLYRKPIIRAPKVSHTIQIGDSPVAVTRD